MAIVPGVSIQYFHYAAAHKTKTDFQDSLESENFLHNLISDS